MKQTRISTCAYCGGKAAFEFGRQDTGQDTGHLACGTCGAPFETITHRHGRAYTKDLHKGAKRKARTRTGGAIKVAVRIATVRRRAMTGLRSMVGDVLR